MKPGAFTAFTYLTGTSLEREPATVALYWKAKCFLHSVPSWYVRENKRFLTITHIVFQVLSELSLEDTIEKQKRVPKKRAHIARTWITKNVRLKEQ